MTAPPRDAAEYQARFHANSQVGGYGLEVHQHMPCPFCAAPGWATWYIAGELAGKPSLDDQMRAESTCSECGRSGKAIVIRDAHGVSAEFVQTGGDDPPTWLTPPPRRVTP